MNNRLNRFEYPTTRHPDFEGTVRFLQQRVACDTRLHDFFRGYFLVSLHRIALNLIYLRGLLKAGDKYLDVGSFGIEPVVLKSEIEGLDCSAISFEGNVIGIDERGFYETMRFDERVHVRLESKDVEREVFRYPDNHFDVITCFEVIEHLKFTPIPMLTEIKRVLKPNGLFILTTPNINSAVSIARILLGESPQECPVFHRDPRYGVVHPKEYTYAQMQNVFTELGFEILSGTSVETMHDEGKIKIAARVIRVLSPLLWLARRLVKPSSLPLNLGEKLLFVAGKGSEIRDPYPRSIFE